MRLFSRFVLGLAGAVALALPAAAQTKWNLPAAYPADNFHTENLTQFAKDVSDATGGKLQIAHGHMNDVANRFEHWEHPFVAGDFGVECLEMCPGTLFMVKFVNKLEAEYPFADNLLPVTKLASVLMRDDKAGYVSVGWMFARLVVTTSGSAPSHLAVVTKPRQSNHSAASSQSQNWRASS